MEPVDYTKLTWGERREVREQYVLDQKGLCWFCHAPLDGEAAPSVMDKKIDLWLFPEGFLDHPIHLQHNHDTDMTEGAVHCHCNAVLWQYHGR